MSLYNMTYLRRVAFKLYSTDDRATITEDETDKFYGYSKKNIVNGDSQ